MKKLLLFVIIISLGYSYSQLNTTNNKESYDVLLQNYIVGSWKHVQSTYPSGNQDFYDREFNLYSDSLYDCIYLSNDKRDTIFTFGYWYVRDTSIFLYTVIDTNIVLGDVTKIEHVDDSLMFLKKLWGFEESRKTSMYKRIE